MTKTAVPTTPKQVAGLGAWFLVFGLGVLLIELYAGDHPFTGKPTSWGLGEVFSVMGGVVLCRAALLRRQQQ
jgi:hypothetical protein